MAKRAPADEATYDPLDHSLAQAVTHPVKPLSREANLVRTQGDGDLQDEEKYRRAPAALKREGDGSALSTRGFERTKRVLLTLEEERDIERLVDRIAEHMGASLKFSHVLRACMTLLCHAEAEIIRHASNSRLNRPANGNAVALAQFEQTIARVLSLALRDAPLLR